MLPKDDIVKTKVELSQKTGVLNAKEVNLMIEMKIGEVMKRPEWNEKEIGTSKADLP